MNAVPSVNLLARATALAAFVLILAGASVTSTHSGLSVPDWPLSYGQWMPPMKGGVFFEHGHRMIAAGVGFLVWCLAALAWAKRSGPWVKGLTLAAAAAVLLQGVLGGITVLYGLAKPISVAHACLAQALFALLVFLAVGTEGEGRAEGEHASVDAQRASSLTLHAAAAAAAVYMQLIFGAAYRHGIAPITPHLAGAILAAVIAWSAAYRGLASFPSASGLGAVSGSLAIVLLAQLLLGLAAFVGSPLLATFHVAFGALTLALCVVLSAKSFTLSRVA